MVKKIVYPPSISKKMCIRFDNLEFCVGKDGYLYSIKTFSDKWDFQTKSFYYRSIGMSPRRIANKLDLNINTLKNRDFLGLITLDYEGKNFKLKEIRFSDWSDLGFIDNNLKFHKYAPGGVPKIYNGDYEVYVNPETVGEILQLRNDLQPIQQESTKQKKTKSQKLYDEWYKND